MSHRSPRLASCAAVLAVTLAGSACAGSPADPTEVVLPVFSQGAPSGEHGTHMHGSQETPARDTRATGQLVLKMLPDGSGLRYKLIVANIENVTASHIHMAAPGVAGPAVVWLYPAAPPGALIPGRSSGVLAEGVITDARVVGPLAGQGIAGLLATIEAGNAYANVHTTQYPPGEIRGQLQ